MRHLPLFLLLLLSSCAAHRAKICKTCTLNQITTTDTIRTETVRIDTLVFETENPCKELCDSAGNLKPFSRDLKSDKGKAIVLYTRNNKLNVKESDTVKTEYKTIVKTITREFPSRCDKEHLTKCKSFFIVSGKIAWVIILILIGGTILFLIVRKVI